MVKTIFHFNLLLELFFYDVHGEYLIQRDGLLFDGMTDMLIEVMSKKKIKKYMLQESVSENGGVEAKAQLMRTITDAIKFDEMDKATKEDIYYQPFPVCAEIPDKKN